MMPKTDPTSPLDDLIEELHQLNADGDIEYDVYVRLHALASAIAPTVDAHKLVLMKLALMAASQSVAHAQGDDWTPAQRAAHNRLRTAAGELFDSVRR